MKGFDAVNITDNQLAICHMSPLAAAAILLQEGITPIPQFTLPGPQPAGAPVRPFWGLHAGRPAIFCVTGDHPSFGNHPDAKPVFEFTVIEFLKKVKALCDNGEYFNGQPIKNPPGVVPKFLIGAAANPNTRGSLKGNIERLEKKYEAGARFFQTQPVFNIEGFERWMEAVRETGLHKRAHFIAGAMPIRSLKSLHHLINDVPGNSVPEYLVQRMEKAADPAKREKDLRGNSQRFQKSGGGPGIHLMSVAWEEFCRRSPAWRAFWKDNA